MEAVCGCRHRGTIAEHFKSVELHALRRDLTSCGSAVAVDYVYVFSDRSADAMGPLSRECVSREAIGTLYQGSAWVRTESQPADVPDRAPATLLLSGDWGCPAAPSNCPLNPASSAKQCIGTCFSPYDCIFARAPLIQHCNGVLLHF